MAKRFTAQLVVSRLSAYTTDQSLRQLFSPFGQIREARLIRDSQTQRPKGFGFITYESEDNAQIAMKALDGKIVNGRLIFVETAKEVEAPTTNMNNNKKLEENTQTESLQNN
ncbi:cold-inducible RNA-binding protein [Eutrema salsugineum]|uniref:cold-inducible RNA-binding protein n=1 Tax=Eutrema salsugineum TaxID=72664 RepID=UPI000CECFE76|nr:cold-inducible RNA-binding protein [Eutrema salsugineum]